MSLTFADETSMKTVHPLTYNECVDQKIFADRSKA